MLLFYEVFFLVCFILFFNVSQNSCFLYDISMQNIFDEPLCCLMFNVGSLLKEGEEA